MVVPLQVILILDVVLIRIVDALEMHDEGFLIMRETHLAFLQHPEEFCMPIFQLVSLIESLSLYLNTRDMKRSLVVESPANLDAKTTAPSLLPNIIRPSWVWTTAICLYSRSNPLKKLRLVTFP